MRTSPRPLTVSGKMFRGTSEVTTDGTPLASRSPRTMLASTSECVRKMMTRSGTSAVHPHEDHRHVVVLRGPADKRRDLAQHALAQFLRRQRRVFLEQPPEPFVAETIVGFVHRLADAVRVQRVA